MRGFAFQTTGTPVSRCKSELDSVTHGTINTIANRLMAVMGERR